MTFFEQLPQTAIHPVFLPIELQTSIISFLQKEQIPYTGKRWNQYDAQEFASPLAKAKAFYQNANPDFGNRYTLLYVPFDPDTFYQTTLFFFGPTKHPDVIAEEKEREQRSEAYYRQVIQPLEEERNKR